MTWPLPVCQSHAVGECPSIALARMQLSANKRYRAGCAVSSSFKPIRNRLCLCDVPPGKNYCGDSCRDAGSNDVEIACQCDHAACPLTIREFVSRLAAQVAN